MAAAKKIKQESSGSVVLPKLPGDVVHNIFTLLPIQNSIQTSIVAKQFFDSWLYCKKLHFGADLAADYYEDDYKSIVKSVLNSHIGSVIESFRLHVDFGGAKAFTEKCIHFALLKHVEELRLFNYCRFKVPVEVFTSLDLKILDLSCCEIDATLHRILNLRSLSSLILHDVTNVTKEFLASVFSTCPFIEFLYLRECHNIVEIDVLWNVKRLKVLRVDDCLNILRVYIDSPTLKTLEYRGDVNYFVLGKIIGLNAVSFNVRPDGFSHNFQITRFLSMISRVRVLTVSGEFIRLALSRASENDQLQLGSLKKLYIFLEGGLCGPFAIASFLKKCPVLEGLVIHQDESSLYGGKCWEKRRKEDVEELNVSYNCLESIRINSFIFEKIQLDLVYFLLTKARASMKTLILDTANNKCSYQHLARDAATNPQLKKLSGWFIGIDIIVY